ncbi:MAG: hypothetical protein ACI4FY_08360 [Acetatifactor sp.]
MKKLVVLLATGVMCAAMTACGQEAKETDVTIPSESITASMDGSQAEISESKSDGEADDRSDASDDSAKNPQGKYQVGDADNFSVHASMVAAFAKEIKAAVAEKDLEALADLAAFPMYIGFQDGGKSVETKDDFLALDADTIFSQELMDAIAAADETKLSASRAGFSLTDTGAPNIVFGVREGRLAVQTINY